MSLSNRWYSVGRRQACGGGPRANRRSRPPEERRRQPRVVTGSQRNLINFVRCFLAQVRDLRWLALRHRERDIGLIETDVLLRQGVNQRLIHGVSGGEMELALDIVEDINGASVGIGDLHCFGHDGRGARFRDRASSLRPGTLRRAHAIRQPSGQIIGALAQLGQQARIFNGDHSLIDEVRNQRDLLVRKRTDSWRESANPPISSSSFNIGTVKYVRTPPSSTAATVVGLRSV